MRKYLHHTITRSGIFFLILLGVAVHVYAATPSSSRHETSNLYEQGIALYLEEKYSEAVIRFEGYLKNNPSDSAAKEWIELIRVLAPSTESEAISGQASEKPTLLFDKLIAKYEKQYKEIYDENVALNIKLEQLLNANQSATEELKLAHQRIQKMKLDAEISEADYEQRIADIGLELRTQKADSQKNIASMKNQIQSLNQSLSQTRSDLEEEKSNQNSSTALLQKVREELISAQREVVVKTEEANQSNRTAEAVRQELRKVHEEMTRFETQTQKSFEKKYEKEVGELNNEIHRIQKSLQESKNQNEKLQNQVLESQTKLEAQNQLSDRVQALSQKVLNVEQNSDDQIQTLSAENAHLKSLLNATHRDMQELTALIESLERNHQNFQKELQNIRRIENNLNKNLISGLEAVSKSQPTAKHQPVEKTSYLKQELNAVLSELNQ